MARSKQPTDAELGILEVLWRGGPATVRQVHDELKEASGTGYTTVLKLMQIMLEKGLVTRDASSRSHVYSAAVEQAEAQGSLLSDLMSKAFAGSAAQLVMRALSVKPATQGELNEIRALLDELQAADDRTGVEQ